MSTETDRLGAAWGGRETRRPWVVAKGMQGFFWGDGNALKLTVVTGYTHSLDLRDTELHMLSG